MSSETIKIFHNPRCSKSRQTLALLQDRGLDVVIIDYLQQAPSAEELKAILQQLNLDADALVRKKEPTYQSLGLATAQLTDDELIAIMVQHPILIERPIVLTDDKATIGRPPENVLAIL